MGNSLVPIAGCCSSPRFRWTAEQVCAGVNLHDKTIVITGATAGLGLESARVLALNGAGRLVLAARDEKKAMKCIAWLKSETKHDNIVFMKLDLDSLASVRSFSQQFHDQGWPLHILMNNAGVMFTAYRKTKDGFEQQIGTNHFGHFYLTSLLLDVLEKSKPSRVVMLSSAAHMYPSADPIRYEEWPCISEKKYDRIRSYQQSKLCNILTAMEFSNRYKDRGVTSYAVHPGVIPTELTREVPCSCLYVNCAPCCCCLKTFPSGASTQVYCAVTPGLEKQSGRYFANCDVHTPGGNVSAAAAKRLWEETEKMLQSVLQTGIVSGEQKESTPAKAKSSKAEANEDYQRLAS
jgi:NAD(P)-dependent dehydrogenase (short-subunit alcohol dehydrogenase family)